MLLESIILCGFVALSARPCCGADDTNSLSTNAAYYSRCDPTIVARIHQVWEKSHFRWPTDVIKKANINGKETVIRTTWKYYADDLKCLTSRFEGYNVITTSVYRNGTCATKSTTVSECEGRSISEVKGIRVYRYHVVQDARGVTGIYTCVDCGVNPLADDEPDGFVKISSFCEDEAAITSCLEVMKSVGINLNVTYPRTCP